MIETNEKHALIEKVAFAILPILFTCVVYLMNSLSHLSHEVTVLNNKISLVVTSDNKQATNTGAELAREKLRQDLEKEIQKNRDDIMHNRQDIAVIYEKMKSKWDIYCFFYCSLAAKKSIAISARTLTIFTQLSAKSLDAYLLRLAQNTW